MNYKNLKNMGEKPLYLGDINQARKYVYSTPLFKDLGFGNISPHNGWTRYKGTMNSSKLKNKFIGWEKKIDGYGYARVRIDMPAGGKKAHYNLEILEKGGSKIGNYKLAVEFDCNGICTEAQILKYVERYQ